MQFPLYNLDINFRHIVPYCVRWPLWHSVLVMLLLETRSASGEGDIDLLIRGRVPAVTTMHVAWKIKDIVPGSSKKNEYDATLFIDGERVRYERRGSTQVGGAFESKEPQFDDRVFTDNHDEQRQIFQLADRPRESSYSVSVSKTGLIGYDNDYQVSPFLIALRPDLSRFHQFNCEQAEIEPVSDGRKRIIHAKSQQALIVDSSGGGIVQWYCPIANPRVTTTFQRHSDGRIAGWRTVVTSPNGSDIDVAEEAIVYSESSVLPEDISFLEPLPAGVIAYMPEHRGVRFIVREDQTLRPVAQSELLSGRPLPEIAESSPPGEFTDLDSRSSLWLWIGIAMVVAVLYWFRYRLPFWGVEK